MAKQSRSVPVMQAVLDAVAERLMKGDESLIRIPEICEATGVNYGSVYHHFGSREGVIDAAYDKMFSSLIESDVQYLRTVSGSATTIEEYVEAMQPYLVSVTAGEERQARRAMRVRIVAAAVTRPDLRTIIGATQARVMDELVRIVQSGQERGFIRRDMSARAVAVFVSVLVFGRTLDDISASPIPEGEWDSAMALLLRGFLVLA